MTSVFVKQWEYVHDSKLRSDVVIANLIRIILPVSLRPFG
jgi:hypothetical protein